MLHESGMSSDRDDHDRATSIGRGHRGVQNRGGRHPSLSADARFIAFSAAAGDLVAKDTNGKVDAFRRGALR